jgi:hypothetical protein
MKSTFIITLLSLFVATTSIAQSNKAQIQFQKTVHNFGTINEADGEKFYSFKFKNGGKAPLIINNVKASCGCTTPEWTKAPIGPGKEGFIKVSFDPKNRPGPFNKSITITSNAEESSKILYIKGSVIAKAKTIDDKYTSKMGGLMFKSNHLAMTSIKNTASKTEYIEMHNPTAKPISVAFDRIPAHIKLDKTKLTVAPKQDAKVAVTYNAAKKNDWGFNTDKIFVIVNNQRDGKNKISVSAEIKEDFSKLTEQQKLNAPKATFKSKMFSFGDIKQGESKSYTYEFSNTGKSDLVIRKIKESCGCTVTKLKSKVIKPGEKSQIDVTFNSKGKSGKQMKTITVITNDPKNSKIVLRVKGNVTGGTKRN